MRRGAYVGRLIGALRAAASAGNPVPVARPPAQRERTWPGEPPTCDMCHRRLLQGERTAFYAHGEVLLLACPLCAVELSGAGLRRQPGIADDDALPCDVGDERVA
jgi:hypothetical protein